MKKMNLAFLYENYFRERDFKRFGVDILSKNFNVYLFEFYSQISETKSSFAKEIKKKSSKNYNVFLIQNYDQFFKLINAHSIKFYIDIMNNSFLSFRIRRLLMKKNTIRIKINLSTIPWIPYKLNLFKKIILLKKSGGFFSKFSKALLNKIYSKLEPDVDIFLCSGSKSKPNQNHRGIEIWTHSFDFQNYLELEEKENDLNVIGSYALFIDQFAPSHPDYLFHNNKPLVTAQNYYRSMNSFFDIFEKKTGLKIIVAGHPKREKNNKNNWNGREQIIGKTAELIKHSTVVLSHYSTALNYAVIYRKPILLITTEEYYNSYRKYQFLAFSIALNIDIINIDKFDKQIITNEIFNINESILEDYEEKYIRSKNYTSQDIWQHFSEKLIEYSFKKNL